MTDQFTYLKQRMERLESKVTMLERAIRPDTDGGKPLGPPPERKQPEQGKSAVRDADLSSIQSVLWSIYDFVTSQSMKHLDNVNDTIEMKAHLRSIERTSSEIRDGVQDLLAKTS